MSQFVRGADLNGSHRWLRFTPPNTYRSRYTQRRMSCSNHHGRSYCVLANSRSSAYPATPILPEMLMLKTVCLVGAVVVSAACSAPASAKSPSNGIDRVSWLAGCWAREAAEAGTSEQWMQPAGGTMLGMARTIKAGKTVEFEFMRIRETLDGKLLFTALPSGQSETTFTELRSDESEIAFQNAAHDFPQRVSYRLEGNTRLMASIEGTRKGVARSIEFPMVRTKCDQ